MTDRNSQVKDLIVTTLQAAVPLWVEIYQRDRSWDQVRDQLPRCGQMIAEHGDNILFKSKKKGENAAAFNALAEALAILSFAPGGVTFLGLHFETTIPDAWKSPPPPV